jgi:hypothetical protein
MESGYSKYRNPYHNLVHAADVLQTTYQIIYNSGLMVEVNGVSLFDSLCSFFFLPNKFISLFFLFAFALA